MLTFDELENLKKNKRNDINVETYFELKRNIEKRVTDNAKVFLSHNNNGDVTYRFGKSSLLSNHGIVMEQGPHRDYPDNVD